MTLQTAKTINVYIPDYSHGVPGSDLPIWQYRKEVDPNWQPGPDYPGIVIKSLPDRRSDMASQAIKENGQSLFGTTDPQVQFSGKSESLDLRNYHETKFCNTTQQSVPIASRGTQTSRLS